jgi:hypothetical protein
VFNPRQQVEIDAFLGPYRTALTRIALYSFEAVAALAVVGAILLRRRRTVPVFPLLAPVAMVLVTVVVTYRLTRFRFAADSAPIVLTAIAIDAAVDRVRARSAQPRAALRSL